MQSPVRVLHIEDGRHAEETRARLRRTDGGFVVHTVPDASDGLDFLTEHDVDCVVSRHELPGMTGVEFLETVRPEHPDLPFVLVTGNGNEAVAAAAIRAGVSGYVRRSDEAAYDGLSALVTDEVGTHRSERRFDRYREAFYGLETVTGRPPEEVCREMLRLGCRCLGPSGARLVHEGPGRDARRTEFSVTVGDDRADARSGPEGSRAAGHGGHAGAQAYESGPEPEPGQDRSLRTEIVVDGEHYGTVRFSWPGDRPPELSAPESAFLELVGRGVGRQLERAESAERLAARQRILDMMHGILSESGATFEGKMRGLLDVGREVIDAEVAVFAHVRDGDYGIECMTGEPTPFNEGDTVPVAVTHCSRTVQREGLVAVERVGERPDALDYVTYSELGYDCYIGTPVHRAGSLYGTVCFHRRDGRDAPFTAWQATIVEILGQWANLLVEQRANVEQLVAERDRLDEFSAVVSHDLRTPLSVARGWIEIARKDGDVTGLVHAAGAIDNATELIDDLLTIARGGVIARQFEAVPVATLVSECWEAVAPAGATLNVTTARTVRGDPGRLRQVFENLFRNSVEHGGPEVTVTVGESDDGLYVADDGPGIPVEDRSRVTAPGYTSTDTGTGFGLNIVSQVVAAHGWELRLDESEGGGLRVEMAFEGRERPDREPLVDGSEEVSPSP